MFSCELDHQAGQLNLQQGRPFRSSDVVPRRKVPLSEGAFRILYTNPSSRPSCGPNFPCLEKYLFTRIETTPQPIVSPIDTTLEIVYIRIMASLQSYSVHGNRYWRIVESFRDKRGRPRIRVVRHLGTAQRLLECLSEAPGRPLYVDERDLGATTALWDPALQLDIVRTIDTHARNRNH